MINHIYSATKYNKAVGRLNELYYKYDIIAKYVILIGKTVKTNKGLFKRKSLYDLAMKQPNPGGRVGVCKYICDKLVINCLPASFTLVDEKFETSNGADYISVPNCGHARYINMVLDDESFDIIKNIAANACKEIVSFYTNRLGDFDGYLIRK